MISSRVWLLAFGMISSLTGCAGADHPEGSDASAADQSEIVSVEDALAKSAKNGGSTQVEATLALGDLWVKDAKTSPQILELLMQQSLFKRLYPLLSKEDLKWIAS